MNQPLPNLKYDPAIEATKLFKGNEAVKAGYDIKIPDHALFYALFQREGAQTLWRSRLLRKFIFYRLPNLFTYHRIVKLESLLMKARAKKRVLYQILPGFLHLEPYLPQQPKNILDIGSGVAIVDVMLYKHYQGKLDIYLLDKTQLDKKYYPGYQTEDRFYSSNTVATELLLANGVKKEQIHFQEATSDYAINFNVQFDLIASFGSWGFHYPLSTYLDAALAHLSPVGVMVVDLRKDTGDLELLKKHFGKVTIISEWKKGISVVARKS